MPQTPILFAALDVITASLQDITAIADSESVDASLGKLGLETLNRLVMQLRTQELSVPFIGREVFPITALQNTYTVGPGGDLDTTRPQSLEGCGLLLNPSTATVAITGVSPTDRTFTVAGDETGTFLSGSDFVVTGSTGNDGSYTIVTAVFSVSTTITVSEVVPSAVADGTILAVVDATATTEIPIALLTDNAYQALRVKGLQNTQFTQAYYNPTYAGGHGLLWLWPKPTINVHALVLYLENYVGTFANLTTRYAFPPGYFDLLEYGLARRLQIPLGNLDPGLTGALLQQFGAAQALVKRQNLKRNDLPTDTAMIGGAGGVYNILTDSR